MLDKKSYRDLKQKIQIDECHEQMLEIPLTFVRYTPHPYQKLGAPYGNHSPFYLRSEVLQRLNVAQERLTLLKHGYKLKIFDAYRPLEVQAFMIEYDTNRIAIEKFNTAFDELCKAKRDEVKNIITHFWSPILNEVKSNPPPHSTGGALDLSIVNSNGIELDMGTKIDEFHDASESDYYHNIQTIYETNRNLLVEVMKHAGFTQLPTEWWHFSYGDQIWALDNNTNAKYGIYIKIP